MSQRKKNGFLKNSGGIELIGAGRERRPNICQLEFPVVPPHNIQRLCQLTILPLVESTFNGDQGHRRPLWISDIGTQEREEPSSAIWAREKEVL